MGLATRDYKKEACAGDTRKLRKQLETKIHEIKEEKGGERGGGGAEDLNLLNAKLEADKAKLEHKVIELMAERQLLEDSISIPK
uniref:Uncharacterized protein n=1 Tax=Amphimedon queenslandica TaxID=400682 RepID=A0A1X7SR10_AMPQE